MPPYRPLSPIERFYNGFLQGLQIYNQFRQTDQRSRQLDMEAEKLGLTRQQLEESILASQQARDIEGQRFREGIKYLQPTQAELAPGASFEQPDPNVAPPPVGLAPPPQTAMSSGLVKPGGPPTDENIMRGLAIMEGKAAPLAAILKQGGPIKVGPNEAIVDPTTFGELYRNPGEVKTEVPNIPALEVFINTKGRIRPKGLPEGLTVDEAKATINQHRELERQRLNITLSQSNFGNADKLRREYLNDSKIFTEVRDMFARVQSSAKNPTPAGDLSMIFAYMKMLDPQSVVRESEFRVAETARPLLEKAGLSWDRVQSVWEGKRLTPEQRQDFLRRATEIYEAQNKSQEQTKKEYRRIAAAAGLDPDSVIVEKGLESPSPSKSEPKQGATVNLPPGIPPGSRVIGKTKSGGIVYQPPQGKPLVVE